MNSAGVVRAVLALVMAAMAVAQGPSSVRGDASGSERVLEDLQYAEGFAREPRRNRLDLYLPAGVAKPPLVMFVHGGFWTGGKKEHGAALARALTRHGIACACINTQEHPFAEPAAMVADCGRALAWLHAHAAEHGFDGERLFVMGHSSGAHLISWLALDDERLAAAGVPRAALRGAIGLSGLYELRTRHAALDKVFGVDPAARRDASPSVHVSAGDPPFLLLWGEHDMAGLPLCGRMLRDSLRAAGVGVVAAELPGCNHLDYVWALAVPEDPVLARIVRFVRDPPAATAPAPPPPPVASAQVSRTDGGAAFAVVRPAGAPLTTLLWCAAGDSERALATRVGEALAPCRVAVAMCTVGSAAEVATAWQQLRQRAAASALPEPAFVGGTSRGGLWVTQAQLVRGDGLRGRVVLGAPLGSKAIAETWPGAPVPNLLAALTAAAGAPPGLLLVHGDHDARATRDETTALSIQLATRHVDVQLVELADATTPAALAQLGTKDDVLLPLLRAFLLP
jgi:acetyl esterase/lipase